MFILSISENILSLIAGVGTLQGVLLACLLYFHPKADRQVNLFLALYIICNSIVMTTALAHELLPWQHTFFMEPFPWLSGPLLYLYIRSFKETITWRKALPHVLPFFLMFFISYWHFANMYAKYPGSETIPEEAIQHPATFTFITVRYAQLLFYYWLGRRTLTSYQRSLKQLFSETTRLDPRWIRWLLNGYLIVVLCSVALFGMILKYPSELTLWVIINMAIGTPYIYLATFKGITQPTLWQASHGLSKETVEETIRETEQIPTEEKPKTTRTTINLERVDELISKIILVMEKEKIYQEAELTLQQVAAKVQAPAYQVSQAINERLQKSFYDLVNSYRVEEAKRLLSNPDNRNYTILSVGFESGFNSKTTFNTVFKKFTGLTPTEFKNQQKMTLVT